MKKAVGWKRNNKRIRHPLLGTHKANYVIVGAGIAGLSVAHFLIQHGVTPSDIVLLEKETAGAGSTGRSAGMLVPEPETYEGLGWGGFIDRYTEPRAEAYRKAHLDALALLRTLIHDAGIMCDATMQDVLLLAGNRTGEEELRADVAALRQFDEHPVELEVEALRQELPISGITRAVKTMPGLSVNPAAFAEGFANHLRRQGVRVYEHTALRTVSQNTAHTRFGSMRFDTLIRT